MTGITSGHNSISLVCLGLEKIFQIYPQLQDILKIICAIYLYLDIKLLDHLIKLKKIVQDRSNCMRQHYFKL